MNANDIPREAVTVFRWPRRIEPVLQATCVFCLAGTAWITLEGQLDDVILEAGESHTVRAREKALLAGMPECRVVIEPCSAG